MHKLKLQLKIIDFLALGLLCAYNTFLFYTSKCTFPLSCMHIILSCMVEFLWYRWCFEQLKFLIAGAIALKGLGGVLFIFGSSFGALLLVCSQNLLYEYIGFHFLLMCFIFLVITLNLIFFLGISSCTSWLLPQSIMIFTIMTMRTKN